MDREILSRYLSGEASQPECEAVEAWLAEDPDRWSAFADLRQDMASPMLSERYVQAAKAEVWARLAKAVGEDPGLNAAPEVRPRGRTRKFAPVSMQPWLRRMSFAAALVIGLLGAGALAMALLHRGSGASTQAIVQTKTLPGERIALRLPDGTNVLLGVASTLKYPSRFGGSREVVLDGEAYFDVAPDQGRPFAVQAGDLVARDLGTQFTVRSYPEDAGARVVVREGRVAIRPSAIPTAHERVVSPGQLGRLMANGEPSIEATDTGAYFAWMEGRLVLDGIPLREALPQLGRWFDLDFRLADSVLGEVPLTAVLRSRPTPDVLNNLAASLGMTQQQHGRTVTFYPSKPGQ